MAYPDLRAVVPPEACRAVHEGREVWALTLLARARDEQPAASLPWAVLERMHGLLLIHVQREVEGTFALERADALLDAAGMARPGLEWLECDDAGPVESR